MFYACTTVEITIFWYIGQIFIFRSEIFKFSTSSIPWKNLIIIKVNLSNQKLSTVVLHNNIFLKIIENSVIICFHRDKYTFFIKNHDFSIKIFDFFLLITFDSWYINESEQNFDVGQIVVHRWRQKCNLWRQLWRCITWFGIPCFFHYIF